MGKISKIINDVNEAEDAYFVKIESINKDFDSAIEAIRSMENSLVYEDKSDEVMAGKSGLTHMKIKLKNYSGDSSKFKFNIVNIK